MSLYLFLKWVHILSGVLMVGTGFGLAYFLFFANRSGNLQGQVLVLHLVVRADWWFTTPAVIVQPITGFWMMHLLGLQFSTSWVVAALFLYALAAACWLPVVWLQIQMARIAKAALAQDTPLPARYWHLAKTWEMLGYPAFAAMLAVFYLMVAKPSIF